METNAAAVGPVNFNGVDLWTRDGFFFVSFIDARLSMRAFSSVSAAYRAALKDDRQ